MSGNLDLIPKYSTDSPVTVAPVNENYLLRVRVEVVEISKEVR